MGAEVRLFGLKPLLYKVQGILTGEVLARAYGRGTGMMYPYRAQVIHSPRKHFTKEGEDGCSITFDMEVNGVTLYGCWYREGKKKDGGDYTMVSFPSQKGKDGKYYNHVYVKLSEEEIQLIGQTIEKVLNA